MQISTGLPRPDVLALRTLEAPEVAMQACIDPRMLSSSLASLLPTLSDHKSVNVVQPIN